MSRPAPLPSIGLVLGSPYTLTAAQGSYAVAGQTSIELTYGSPLSPAPLPHLSLLGGFGGNVGTTEGSTYVVSGQSASLLRGFRLVSDAGFYTLSGQPAIFNLSANRGGDPASLPHLGLVLRTNSTNYTLTADPGAYSVTGSDGLADYEMSSAQGSYGLTGQDAGLRRTVIFTADAGSYSISGQVATFSISSPARSLLADQSTYQLTGFDAGLFVGTKVSAEQGFYALLGQGAELRYGVASSYSMLAETGDYRVFGNDASSVFGGYVLTADAGSYLTVGQSTIQADAAPGPFHKKFRRKYAVWIGSKKYLGTQEDFERLAESSVTGASKELPAISVKLDLRKDEFAAEAKALEQKLEAALREIQRRAYKRKKEEMELLELL